MWHILLEANLSCIASHNTIDYCCSYLNTDETDENNVCDLKSIGNPDGIGLMDEFDTLLIAEDATSAHQNDVAWAYNLCVQITRTAFAFILVFSSLKMKMNEIISN